MVQNSENEAGFWDDFSLRFVDKCPWDFCYEMQSEGGNINYNKRQLFYELKQNNNI